MIFLEYESLKDKYKDAQKVYDSILTEKEEIFQRTQPQAVQGKERVSGGKGENTFDQYLIEIEDKQIEARLTEAKSIMLERERMLSAKREELRASPELKDKVYRYRYIEKMKIYRIASLINYSERQVSRILEEIRIEIKMA